MQHCWAGPVRAMRAGKAMVGSGSAQEADVTLQKHRPITQPSANGPAPPGFCNCNPFVAPKCGRFALAGCVAGSARKVQATGAVAWFRDPLQASFSAIPRHTACLPLLTALLRPDSGHSALKSHSFAARSAAFSRDRMAAPQDGAPRARARECASGSTVQRTRQQRTQGEGSAGRRVVAGRCSDRRL